MAIHIRRRQFIKTLGGAVIALPFAELAQQAVPVVGFISPRSPEDSAYLVKAFRRGLKEGGFVDGENVVREFRWVCGGLQPAAGARHRFVSRVELRQCQ